MNISHNRQFCGFIFKFVWAVYGGDLSGFCQSFRKVILKNDQQQTKSKKSQNVHGYEPLWYAHSTALPQSYPTSLVHLSDVLNLVQGSKTPPEGFCFCVASRLHCKNTSRMGFGFVVPEIYKIFCHNLFPRADFLERLFRNRSYYGVPVRICSLLEPLN